MHKAGFVNIVGMPNVGKSTLINALVQENISIVTNKPQTTRHRILGILSGEDFQMVYSDTPGVLVPKYALQKRMLKFAYGAISDADIIIWIVDINDTDIDRNLYRKFKTIGRPILLILNKIDTLKKKQSLDSIINDWQSKVTVDKVIPISALLKTNLDQIHSYVLQNLPEHPPYFDKDTFTDKPKKFFVTEIIREKILLNYREEIPYCVEVVVDLFIETENLIKISTVIYVNTHTQKGILIGKDASSIKKISTDARLDMERFFGKKIYLEQYVKVIEKWREKEFLLNKFGYT